MNQPGISRSQTSRHKEEIPLKINEVFNDNTGIDE
jgi:hypothetical protein